VVFVTGKGGVGKSSVAAALARAEADRGGRAIVVEFEGAAGATRALGAEREGVTLLVIEYLEALAESIASMLGSRLLGKLMVKQRTLKKVVLAVPAVRELVALDRVRALRREHPDARIFVDLPATGHAVDWLRVPAAAERFLKVGPAAKMCRAIQEDILTSAGSGLVVVSTAEPVVASETRELVQRLEHELGRAPDLVVVNRVPRQPTATELSHARAAAAKDPAFSPLAHALAEDAELGADALLALTSLAGVSKAKILEVPELFRDPSSRELAGHLGARA
jgi:anion-transporting  ArsA/GET3 family ATPase